MALVHLVASIFLIAFIPALSADLSEECPPRDLSTPCSCERWDSNFDHWGTWTQGKNILTCEKVSESEVITDVMNRTKDYGYEFLRIISPDIESLPISMFKIRNITRLFVLSASMRSMFDGTPPAKDLREFNANFVNLSEPLQWDFFEGMPNLERFAFSSSPSLQLDDQFVQHAPKSLVVITINSCSLSGLPNHAFQAMENLKILTIEDGRIEKLEKTMFPSQIEEFSFQNQRIQVIPSDLFSDMPKLRFVSLSRNLISKLPEDTFGDLLKTDSLVALLLQGNPTDCDCSLGWIASLDDFTQEKVYGTCEKPKNMHGKELRYLTSDDFNEC